METDQLFSRPLSADVLAGALHSEAMPTRTETATELTARKFEYSFFFFNYHWC